MKTPVVLVAVSLAMAILLSASLLIATGARGEDGSAGLARSRKAGFHRDSHRIPAMNCLSLGSGFKYTNLPYVHR